jgi:hypothetical protein
MPNLLATEPSAYLKSAAHQPVHWHPWGEAALERARVEDKPILLDIGAVWCHWCHVMDGESYEDPEVAELLNRDFVCVKVDRDERPDVDSRYQRAVQALTGQGGWPLTAFLTPAGEVFFGGTYFPPEDNQFGRPGFISVLKQVAELYQGDRARVAKNAKAIRQHLTESLNEAKAGQVTPAILADAAGQMARLFDIRYGGFGTAPKFPHPAGCDFLLARWHDTHEVWIREVVEKTLTGMAKGGIRDHVGGGFHRYAVDERWIVPHFEKMAYDNSELLRSYLNAYAAYGTPLFAEVAQGTVTWVLETLSDPARGAFYTSQDADVEFGDDGDYWTWTPDELREALHDETAYDVIRRVYDVAVPGEMHHDHEKNVLWWKTDPADAAEWQTLKAAIGRLKTARARRKAPYVDTTPYVNWNAMMAAAFLQRARLEGAEPYLGRSVGRRARHGPRDRPDRAARPAGRQHPGRGGVPRRLRGDRRRGLAHPRTRGRTALHTRPLGRSGRRVLGLGARSRRRSVPGDPRQADSGRPDSLGQRRRRPRAGPGGGDHRRPGVAPAARPPARDVRGRGGPALAVRRHAAPRRRLGAQPRHPHRGGRPARRGTHVRHAPPRAPDVPAPQGRDPEDGGAASRHGVRGHDVLPPRRDRRRPETAAHLA